MTETRAEDLSTGSVFDSMIPPKVIKGWNDRRQSNNQVISGLMPFVQLIGVFDDSEFDKIFSYATTDEEGKAGKRVGFQNRRDIVYSDENDRVVIDADGTAVGEDSTGANDVLRYIKEQLEDRFVNLYIAEGRQNDDEAYLAITPSNGILMAEAVPQTIDGSGGIGISDLQVENRTDGIKQLTMRLTVNDPKLLNERPEYAKMSTLQGEFIVIYGWSNPNTVDGFNASSPPQFVADPTETNKLMMQIPMGNLDSGGYWSAERMNITGYDFAFNELGQLEVTLKLMSRIATYLATTRLSSISNTWKKLMGTYDYSDGNVAAAEGGFTNVKVTTTGGELVNLATAAQMEQLSYNTNNQSAETEGNDVAPQPQGISIADLGANNKSLSEVLEVFDGSTQSYTGNAADQNTEDLIRQRRESESLGYPYAPGISSYEKVTKFVPIEATGSVIAESDAADYNAENEGENETQSEDPVEGEETLNTAPVTDYKSKVVYYYLGWVMDGVKLSLSDQNRGALLSGEKKIIPKFHYLSTTPDSQITSAFQSQVRRANSTNINKRIQDAVIRLKEKCMPPYAGSRRPYTIPPSIRNLTENIDGAKIKGETATPCRGQALVDGAQTRDSQTLAQILFPTPIGAPVELPHRGEITTLRFNRPESEMSAGSRDRAAVETLRKFDEDNGTSFLDLARTGDGVKRFYIPDWYVYYDDEGNPTGGSEEGFDPFNPTDYKAADRNGRFYYAVTYAVKFSSSFLGIPVNDIIASQTFGVLGTGSDVKLKDNILNFTRILEVDEYRQESPEIWNLTQRRWHNLYIVYLGNHFENLIKQRIAELQAEGREVEDIYDEPVDLDFLTGKQYRNWRFAQNSGFSFKSTGRKGSSTRFGGNEEVTNIPPLLEIRDRPVDDDLLDTIAHNEGRLPSLNEERESVVQSQDELAEQISEKVRRIKALQTIESATLLDRENAGIEQLTGGRYSREAFDADGNLIQNIRMGVVAPGSGVTGVQLRSSYGYYGKPTGLDPAGNRIYSGFSNFRQNIRGSLNSFTNEYEALIELNNQRGIQTPIVNKEYVIYALYGARTNNFIKSDGGQGNEQIRFINEATAEGVLENFFFTGIDVDNDGDVDFDDFFILADDFNPSDYREQRVDNIVEELQKIVNRKMAIITRISSELEPLYAQYDSYNLTLDAIDSQISEIENKLRELSRFSTEDGRQVPLSLYDDTSDFDDVLEVDVGRAEPMRLESKVAQQWYRVFDDVVQRGATDVTNYGPAKGGTPYFAPSNTRAFRYNDNKRTKSIVGYPKIIFDPGTLNPSTGYERAKLVPRGRIVSLNEDAPTTRNPDGRTLAFVNWQLFGNPDPPESDSEDEKNSYGFRSGPRIEQFDSDGNLINVAGGNYVKDYQEFLGLFNTETNPNLPGQFTIIGEWPDSETDTPYYMIDEADNIIQEGTGENVGWYEQSGWYLGSGELPIYLYPGRNTATQIDPTKTTASMPFGVPNGEYGFTDADAVGDSMGANGDVYDDKGKRGQRNNLYNQLGAATSEGGGGRASMTKSMTTWTADWDELQDGPGAPLANISDDPTQPVLVNSLRDNEIVASLGSDLDVTDFSTYGCRIGRNEHCMNLTLDMKRALVINRRNFYGPPLAYSTRKCFFSLGDDDPTMSGGNPGSAGKYKVNWNELTKKVIIGEETKIFDYWVAKNDLNAGTADMKPVYALAGSSQASIDAYEPDGDNYIRRPIPPFVDRPPIPLGTNLDDLRDEEVDAIREAGGIENYNLKIAQDQQYITIPYLKPRKGARVVGREQDNTRVKKSKGYSNQYYPYGTGEYQLPEKQYGSAAFPEKSPNKNWLYIGDFLDRLPGRGFFTKVNNRNNSPTMLLPDGQIVDGDELNVGFVKFVIENVLAPLPKNRRIGSRSGDDIPRGRLKVINAKWLGDHDEWRIQDVTYGHLFRPEDPNENLRDIGFADLSNFTIDNVADIPIRRDVIENLMNKQNSNMSIHQFFQEIMRPDSIGVNGSNINVGMRVRTDGVMDVFSASKNWRNTAAAANAEIDAAIFANRYPTQNILFDYKKDDSLIEKIDMNSKFDAGITLTFELGARAFAGDPNKFAQFLSFGNIAVELRDFLKLEDPNLEDVIQIRSDSALGETGTVTYAKSAFFGNATGDTKTVPPNLITKFLMQKPDRMAKLNAMLGADAGSNFATQLLSNYMRKTTLTIHGTTGIVPYNSINIRGVLPQLEGTYLVTNVRESITPSTFQTIIEGVLIQNISLDEVGNADS